jgi:putative SOS response-associated peptidase YedK
MCGRFLIVSAGPTLAAHFGVPDLATLAPRFNVAPSQTVPAIGLNREGERALATFRWGLVPRWAADTDKAPINARAETAATKPYFADSLARRRCLIPADGFYEWLRQGRRKQPFCFRQRDDRPFAFAGIWDAWGGPEDRLLSCAILTTEANEVVRSSARPKRKRQAVFILPLPCRFLRYPVSGV